MDFKRLDKIYDELKKAFRETEKAILENKNGQNDIVEEMSIALDILIYYKNLGDEIDFLLSELRELKKYTLKTNTENFN